MGWLAAGRITPHVSHRLPLEQAAAALKLVIARQVIGKAVLGEPAPLQPGVDDAL